MNSLNQTNRPGQTLPSSQLTAHFHIICASKCIMSPTTCPGSRTFVSRIEISVSFTSPRLKRCMMGILTPSSNTCWRRGRNPGHQYPPRGRYWQKGQQHYLCDRWASPRSHHAMTGRLPWIVSDKNIAWLHNLDRVTGQEMNDGFRHCVDMARVPVTAWPTFAPAFKHRCCQVSSFSNAG
ncbi:MAG: hypothetical protein CM1200mP41_11120 [Gammaproteobacteria bacterium]|nr:MAG: hypothetical protein CM1200mP41_11120 [Gammaproteobacteria bacterium]